MLMWYDTITITTAKAYVMWYINAFNYLVPVYARWNCRFPRFPFPDIGAPPRHVLLSHYCDTRLFVSFYGQLSMWVRNSALKLDPSKVHSSKKVPRHFQKWRAWVSCLTAYLHLNGSRQCHLCLCLWSLSPYGDDSGSTGRNFLTRIKRRDEKNCWELPCSCKSRSYWNLYTYIEAVYQVCSTAYKNLCEEVLMSLGMIRYSLYRVQVYFFLRLLIQAISVNGHHVYRISENREQCRTIRDCF